MFQKTRYEDLSIMNTNKLEPVQVCSTQEK